MVEEPFAPTFWIVGAEGVDCVAAFPALGIAMPSPTMKSEAPEVMTLLVLLVVTVIVAGAF